MNKMQLFLLFLLIDALTLIAQDKPFITLHPGTQIHQDVFVAPYDYDFYLTDYKPIIIEGKDITIDFAGATFYGSAPDKDPDQYEGIALIIRNSENVRIQNLRIRGFKTALYIENSTGVYVKNCDFSYNYRPRLFSYRTNEVISDWISLHQNENDEWLDHGPAVYAKNLSNSKFESIKITGCQHGILMHNSHSNTIQNSFIHFNSGVGIGMYRSNQNRIYYNFLDYNVRGYSHGHYRRGQDSAGVLLFEQCNQNIIAFNSITHSGDGIFLWAGNETLEKGMGGSNDNFLYRNDVSFAPTNGIEVTFSSNRVIENTIEDCLYGIWGGYSYSTLIHGNTFSNNQTAIAIEHGHGNTMQQNTFFKDQTGVKLWQRNMGKIPWPGISAQDQAHNTNSIIAHNYFERVDTPFSISDSRHIMIIENTTIEAGQFLATTGNNKSMTIRKNIYHDFNGKKPGWCNQWRNRFPKDEPVEKVIKAYNDLPDMQLPEFPLNTAIWPYLMKGLPSIMITPWGPYDFRYPYVHVLEDTDHTSRLMVLGPTGSRWSIQETYGLDSLNKPNGGFTDTLLVHKNKLSSIRKIVFKYTGSPFMDAYGNSIGEDQTHYFDYTAVDSHAEWHLQYYDSGEIKFNPDTYPDLNVEKVQPIKTETVDQLNKNWWEFKTIEGKILDKFTCRANGKLMLSAGTYEFLINAIGKIMVYSNGMVVFDGWNSNPSYPLIIPITTGGTPIELDIFYENEGGFSSLTGRVIGVADE